MVCITLTDEMSAVMPTIVDWVELKYYVSVNRHHHGPAISLSEPFKSFADVHCEKCIDHSIIEVLPTLMLEDELHLFEGFLKITPL